MCGEGLKCVERESEQAGEERRSVSVYNNVLVDLKRASNSLSKLAGVVTGTGAFARFDAAVAPTPQAHHLTNGI